MSKGVTLTYLLTDQLGSTSLAVNASGAKISEVRYKPWGEVRYESPSSSLPTDYTYTGQRNYTDSFGLMYYGARWYDSQLGRFAQADSIITGAGNQSGSTIGDVANNQYTALTTGYYEPAVIAKLNQDNAFLMAKGGLLNLTQQDRQKAHIVNVPSNSQAFDRYAYSSNNSLKYTDPTGYDTCGSQDSSKIGCKSFSRNGKTYYKLWWLGKTITIQRDDNNKAMTFALNRFMSKADTYSSNMDAIGNDTIIAFGAGVVALGGVGIGVLTGWTGGGLVLSILVIGGGAAGGVAAIHDGYQAYKNKEQAIKDSSGFFDELSQYNEPDISEP